MVVIVVLAITTMLDVITGVEGTGVKVYASIPFAALWAVLAILAASYIVRMKLWRAKATMLIHAAFFVILYGALTTYNIGGQGSMHVRTERATNQMVLKDGEFAELPFSVQLEHFDIKYYQGTSSPEDFISQILIVDDQVRGTVSMNNIFKHRHYRFYQTGYDADLNGSKFNISHDPYGIAITYTGYAMLLLGMIAYFFQRRAHWRSLLIVALLLSPMGATANSNQPKIAPEDVANDFADLYIYYNTRVCPVESYAHDFTMKLCGKTHYRGRSANEILCGWIFFPNTWKPEPMIKVKGGDVKRLIGKRDKFVSVMDFANNYGEYKLQDAMTRIYRGESVPGASNIKQANEKVNILNALFTGAALKIFPVRTPEGNIEWLAPNDNVPDYIPADQALFIRKSLDYVAEMIITRRYSEARQMIAKIKDYQERVCGADLPSSTRIKAEKLYNRVASSKVWAMMLLTVGLIAAALYSTRHAQNKWLRLALNIIAIVAWLFISLCIVLRTIVAQHLPLSNGYETMQALAWFGLLLTLFLQRKFAMALPFGLIISGLALLVAMIGESNPAITSLTPVLNSPLLSAHVMVIMIAYALLAFILLNGISALIASARKNKTSEETLHSLRRTSELMLYPAVFLLTTGVFIGAIWANVSWGRYWGWDAKEVWALITMLTYSLPLHQSIAWFRNDRHFHLYVSLAFLTVLMTYFGANFFIPGLHSYA